MIGETFSDEMDCGNFFDQIDDLLDFPTEDFDDDGALTTNAAAFPPIWSSAALPHAADSVFSGNTHHSALSVPYEDIDQLEWLSNFIDDSSSGAETLTINTSSLSPANQFQISSPVSVLDSSSSSSSSCSGEKKTLAVAGKRGRTRSKRSRPPSFIPRPPQLISATNSGGKVSSDSENYGESCSAPPLPVKKTKKIKLSFRRDQNDAFSPQGVRKCLHCEVTKTPQWRAGPLGPKTLCNACGVRYKSGRLFPEYRPAASPTFVPCLHSNSHRKVLEMRTKQEEIAVVTELPTELIPNTNSGIVLGYV